MNKIVSKSNGAAKRWVLIGIAALVLVLIIYGIFHVRERRQAIKRVFPSASPSAVLVSYGKAISVFRDGYYVVVFKISESEIQSLLEQEGFKVQTTKTDSKSADFDRCNYILDRIVKVDVRLTPSFDSYSKDIGQNRIRAFYDKNQQLAVVVESGKFAN